MLSSMPPMPPSMPRPHLIATVLIAPCHSLEERLRTIRERCRLLADLFALQATAASQPCQTPLSADACHALTALCRASADDLERLAREMPGAVANWQPGGGSVAADGTAGGVSAGVSADAVVD